MTFAKDTEAIAMLANEVAATLPDGVELIMIVVEPLSTGGCDVGVSSTLPPNEANSIMRKLVKLDTHETQH